MMYDIVVIGDEDTVNGFRLAGVKRSFVADSKEVALRIIRENSDAGIIIITETLAEEMGDIERLKKGKVPIIVIDEIQKLMDIYIKNGNGVPLPSHSFSFFTLTINK